MPKLARGMDGNRFTDHVCLIGGCRRSAQPDAPFSLCLHHARVAHAYYVQHVADATSDYDRPAKPRLRRGLKVGRVYFIRRGDLIKIGWSGDPQKRLADLKGDALLHDQPGTMADERLLHRAFEAQLVAGTREWFYDTPVLRDFISKLRSYRATNAA